MNPYALLPLTGMIANLVLAFFILKKYNAGWLNKLYGLAALSLVLWSLGDFITYSAKTLPTAFFWDKISSMSSMLTVTFLLCFCLYFTKNKLIKNKLFFSLLFLPVIFFTSTDFLFNTITKSIKSVWWGHRGVNGDFFILFILFDIAYIIIAILSCYRYLNKTKDQNDKIKTMLIIIALSIPLAGGIITEAVPQIFHISIMPLTTALTTCTALIIGYAIIKYKLLAVTPSVAANSIIETLADSLFVSGNNQKIQLVNQAICQLLGYEKKELIGQPIQSLFSNRLFFSNDLFNVLATKGKIVNCNTTYLSKFKVEIPISLNASIIKNKEGEFIGIVGIARDITNQLKSEEELKKKNSDIEHQRLAILNILEDVSAERDMVKKERDKTNTILKSIGDGVMVVDHEQKVQFLNPVAEELTGWRLKDATGKSAENIFNIFNEATMAKRESPISEAIKTGQTKNLANHTILKTKDDQIIPIADSAAPIKDIAGKISGAVLVFRDVIKERMAEEKLKMAKNTLEKLNLSLDKKVSEKTEELQKAYDELLSLDKMKDEFLNISAHELKTPLTSIIGLSEILILKKQGSINVQQKKSLKIVNNEANRLLNIIKKILGITRIEAGKAVFELKKTDLCPLAAKMINSIKPLAARQSVEIICKKPNQAIWVNVDAERIQEVIYNLIDNALKFSPPGSKIFISGEILNNEFIFSVKDQGPGIDPSKKDKLFQKFSQLDTGFSRKQEGTGLGLYISKITMENMDGKIWVESKPGQGANFKFSLPLSKK